MNIPEYEAAVAKIVQNYADAVATANDDFTLAMQVANNSLMVLPEEHERTYVPTKMKGTDR